MEFYESEIRRGEEVTRERFLILRLDIAFRGQV